MSDLRGKNTYSAYDFAIPRADLANRLTLTLTASASAIRLRLAQNPRELSLVDPYAAHSRPSKRRKARLAISLALALQIKGPCEVVHQLAHALLHRREREHGCAPEVHHEGPHVLGDRVEADGRCCRLSGGFARLFAFLLFLCRREEVRGGGCESLELA
jgi:hypothetical protein